MSYSALWAQTTLTKKETANYISKHWDLLKWKNYKENILEVGCADGSITRDMLYPKVKDHLEKLIAVDMLDEMINFARKQNNIDKIDFQTMDILAKESVEQMRGKFDHIFSFYVAHWMSDQRQFLQTLYDMLKPDGQIFVTIMVNAPVHQVFKKHYKEGTWAKYYPEERFFPDYTDNPVQYICNVMNDVGFKVDVCEHHESTQTVALSDFVKVMVAMYKYVDHIPPELLDDYYKDHLENHRQICTYLREPDLYDFPYHTLLCIGSKKV